MSWWYAVLGGGCAVWGVAYWLNGRYMDRSLDHIDQALEKKGARRG